MQLDLYRVAILGGATLILLLLVTLCIVCIMRKKKGSKWIFSGRVSRSHSLSSKDSLAGSSSSVSSDIEMQTIKPELLELAKKPEPLNSAFKCVGQSSDPNTQFRRTMEDAHLVIDKFADDPTAGFFAVYDGHGGREVVDYVLQNLHKNLEAILKESPPSKKHKKKKHSKVKKERTKDETANNEIVLEVKDEGAVEQKTLIDNDKKDEKEKENILSNSGDPVERNKEESQGNEKDKNEKDSQETTDAPAVVAEPEVKLDSYQRALKEAFARTDQQIIDLSITKSGCTAVSCLVVQRNEKRYLYTANVGDSHAILCRKGKAVQLSFEHKPTDAGELHRLKTQNGGIFVFNNRVAGSLAVSRAFGNLELKKWVISDPHLKKVPLRRSDTFLILACDGLWDVCSYQQAVDIVSKEMAKGNTNSQYLSEMLLQFALQHRTTDNLTVLVVIL